MSLYNQVSAKHNNANLNSVGSKYATDYNHDIQNRIEKITNRMIFDSAPKQFFDLKFLNMFPAENVKSDEFFYQEMGYQRQPIVATASASAVSDPSTQTFGVQDLGTVSENLVVSYQDGTKGTIISVDTTASEITVAPMRGGSLPAVVSGDMLANVSTVDHDGSEGFASQFRADTIERSNFIQLFNMSIKYGEMELYKLEQAGTTDNFLSMERNQMFMQHRLGLSNAFWTGKKGEVLTADGTVAKTTGGVHTSMLEAGSPYADATESTLKDAFEDMVFESEYGDYGDVRFAYMRPKLHRILSNVYKDELVRYKPNDTIASLNLNEINVGSSRIVIVPFKRFEDQASFPTSFANKIMILDHKNIKRCQTWGERSGETLTFKDGIAKRSKEIYVDTNMGVKFNNPLGCAHLNVSGL